MSSAGKVYVQYAVNALLIVTTESLSSNVYLQFQSYLVPALRIGTS